jgi:hypothetical protein
MGSYLRCSVLSLVLLAGLLAAPGRAEETPTAHFGGRVVDAAGRPVAGAQLWVAVERLDLHAAFLARELGATGEDGRFALDTPQTPLPQPFSGGFRPWPKRWRYLTAAWHADHGLGWARAQQGEEAEVRLVSPAVLRGTVLDAGGAPLPEVRLRVERITLPRQAGEQETLDLDGPSGPPAWAQAESDARGAFALTGLPRGASLRLRVLNSPARGYEWGEEWPPDLGDLKLSEPTSELTVRLVTTPVITGRLLLPDGKTPAAHLDVTAVGGKRTATSWDRHVYSAATDEEGRYRIVHLNAGIYTIWVGTGEYTGIIGREVAVTRDQRPELPPTVLQQNVWVEGRVLDADTGAPIPGAEVVAQRRDPPSPAWGGGAPRYRTGPGGRYRARVPPAEVDLSAYGPSQEYGPSVTVSRQVVGGSPEVRVRANRLKPSYRMLHPKPGEDITGVNLYLQRGVEVAGRVVGPDGKPWSGRTGDGRLLPGRSVGAHADPEWVTGHLPWVPGAYLEADGSFVLRGLCPGVPVVLTAYDREDEVGGAVRVTPEAERRGEVVLALGSVARVAGRVLLPDGGPAAGATVRMVPTRYPVGETGPDGRFDLPGGVPGLPCQLEACLLGTDPDWMLRRVTGITLIRRGRLVADVGDILLRRERRRRLPIS